MDRRARVDVIARHRLGNGVRAWRKLIHCLLEMNCLFGPFAEQLCSPPRVCDEINYWLHFFVKLSDFVIFFNIL